MSGSTDGVDGCLAATRSGARPAIANRAELVGYHVIFSTYGFWLPNDPRGSWSNFVASWDLFLHGRATKTTETRSLARRPHDAMRRRAAKSALQNPPVRLSGIQARSVGIGFGRYVRQSGLPVWACAIMPDHVHLVFGVWRLQVEQTVIQLKGTPARELKADGLYPTDELGIERDSKVFARGEWKVFLHPGDVRRAIRYVENNPLKENKRRQNWSFVVPYMS